MTTHSERRHVPYTPEQMFDLVAGVEDYPHFLPWCTAARVREKTDRLIVADLAIGYKAVRERFTSRVTLDRPRRIDVTYTEGPFKYLNNYWIFEPAADGGCDIDFHVEFEFRSRLLQGIIGLFFHEAVRRMVRAFETRATQLYGPVPDGARAPVGSSA
ncbi:MAG: type II toxin-antitoxin system RatA family toxin [Alphaproteobacteria bacterium]